MERVTQKDLENLISRLNETRQGEPWDKYDLDYAYDGVQVVLIVNSGGAQRTISTDGYGTKRQAYSFMRAMLAEREE